MNKLSIPVSHINSQKGMTFLEVLIALVIIVTGILGAVAMQAAAKQASFDAMQRSLASSLSQDIISRIRANSTTNLAAYVGDKFGETLNKLPNNRCNTPNALCTTAQMAANDIYEWEVALIGADVTGGNRNRGGLVGGRGCIFQKGNALTVVVSWQARSNTTDSPKEAGCGTAGNQRRQVVADVFVF